MAKSKQQKQQEAIERKRALYSVQLERVMNYRVDGRYYNDLKEKFGLERAEFDRKEAERVWAKYLKEAQIDAHSNPIPEDQLRLDGTILAGLGKVVINKDYPGDKFKSGKYGSYRIHDYLNDSKGF